MQMKVKRVKIHIGIRDKVISARDWLTQQVYRLDDDSSSYNKKDELYNIANAVINLVTCVICAVFWFFNTMYKASRLPVCFRWVTVIFLYTLIVRKCCPVESILHFPFIWHLGVFFKTIICKTCMFHSVGLYYMSSQCFNQSALKSND